MAHHLRVRQPAPQDIECRLNPTQRLNVTVFKCRPFIYAQVSRRGQFQSFLKALPRFAGYSYDPALARLNV